jgi:hypothetical protein
MQDEYARHYYLLESQKLLPHERDYFQKIIDLKGDVGNYENSLGKLLVFLTRFYNKRAVILIDEYDAPVHAGFNYGYKTLPAPKFFVAEVPVQFFIILPGDVSDRLSTSLQGAGFLLGQVLNLPLQIEQFYEHDSS